MPLEPLKETTGPLRRISRLARGVPLTAFGFATLIGFNGLQTASLALIPFSKRAFRSFNRWCPWQSVQTSSLGAILLSLRSWKRLMTLSAATSCSS